MHNISFPNVNVPNIPLTAMLSTDNIIQCFSTELETTQVASGDYETRFEYCPFRAVPRRTKRWSDNLDRLLNLLGTLMGGVHLECLMSARREVRPGTYHNFSDTIKMLVADTDELDRSCQWNSRWSRLCVKMNYAKEFPWYYVGHTKYVDIDEIYKEQNTTKVYCPSMFGDNMIVMPHFENRPGPVETLVYDMRRAFENFILKILKEGHALCMGVLDYKFEENIYSVEHTSEFTIPSVETTDELEMKMKLKGII